MNPGSINRGRAGVLGVLVLAGALAAALLVPHATFLAGTNEYTANVANASGLQTGGQVYVAGVPSGRLTDMRLAGDHVAVTFRLDSDQRLGDTTSAEIKIQTVLGRRYLAVHPSGSAALEPGATIPVSRTTVPFDVGSLARAASDTSGRLDTAALRDSIATMRDNLPHDGKLIGDTLEGISGVSAMLSTRDGQIQRLLRGAQTATEVLIGQRGHLRDILHNAQTMGRYLIERRAAIARLLTVVRDLSGRLNEMIAQNKDRIDPLLTNLVTLSDGLKKHEKLLAGTLANMSSSLRYLSNATGNGPWVDIAVPGLVLPDNVVCTLGLVEGCR